jgi:ribosomal protein L16 Arg81 hydroxylase
MIGHPVRANCYLAPAQSNGLSLHHDSHDNIIIQVAGRRKWEVYGLYGGRPVPGEKPDFIRNRQKYVEVVRQTEALVDRPLIPKDIMFIPAGCPHEARTEGTPSLHLTFGVHRVQWRDLALRISDLASTSSKFRAALPPRSFPGAFKAAAEAAVAELMERLQEVDPVAAAENLVKSSLPALAGSGSGAFAASFQEECEISPDGAGLSAEPA